MLSLLNVVQTIPARLPAYGEQAKGYFREPDVETVPDYLKLVERHNRRRS